MLVKSEHRLQSRLSMALKVECLIQVLAASFHTLLALIFGLIAISGHHPPDCLLLLLSLDIYRQKAVHDARLVLMHL